MAYTKERCWCGISTHGGTQIIGWFIIVCSILSIVAHGFGLIFDSATASSKSAHASHESMIASRIVSIFGGLFNIGITYMMLHGLRIKRPGYYIPYLVWIFLGIICSCIVIVLLFIASILIFAGLIDQVKPDQRMIWGIGLLLVQIPVILLTALHIYLFFVVPNRSRKLLIEGKH